MEEVLEGLGADVGDALHEGAEVVYVDVYVLEYAVG